MPDLSKKKQRQLRADGYDLEFISKIQPQGNVDFEKHDRYWTSGDGYHTVLHYYEYPSKDLDRFWLSDLLQIPGTRAFLASYRENNSVLKSVIADSIEEKSTRITGNSKITANQKELDEIQDLQELNRDITKKNITMLGFYIRVFVSASTKEQLFKKVDEIKDKTSSYKSTILSGELDFEYHSTFIPAEYQVDQLNHRRGMPIRAHDLAGGYFFNHTKLEDERGSYMGWTPTGGAVNFNFLERDDRRTRSFMLLSGNPKMGQRTFLLKHTDALYAKGNFIRNFDANGSFTNQTNQQFGQVLDLSGGNNRINILQIFPTVTEQNGIDVDEEKSYKLHIQKLKNFLKLLNEDITSDDLTTFGRVLNEFYIENDLWFRNPALHKHELRATKLNREEYPIISDLVLYLADWKGRLERQKTPNKIELKAINRIYNTFDELITSNGDMFEGTTEFKDISSEQVVTFNFAGLKSSPNLLNAQILSVLSLVSADILNNSKKCQQLRRENPSLSEMDMLHYIVNISDAQTLINPKFESSVTLLADIIDSMGDNYAGVVLSVNSLQGLLFEEGAGSHKDPYILAVKRIFGLMQYRVFAQTDETSIPLLANALAGSMNQSELETLPRLSRGQLFMNIAGVGNIVFNQQLLQSENVRYGGIE
ncbi:virulence factor [Streptococcus agalactiae]|uniref:virulence factor n=1 Tax=Streptococcus agalactiae TaxID=1311 RepID=UPI001374D543|nr:virulence factor [Streptococcus agalactiae]KAF1260965.1 virulence factor [Streptococcus agalactiae]KAF1271384.1 virulence factor [Streptococcus agalactiae]